MIALAAAEASPALVGSEDEGAGGGGSSSSKGKGKGKRGGTTTTSGGSSSSSNNKGDEEGANDEEVVVLEVPTSSRKAPFHPTPARELCITEARACRCLHRVVCIL